MFKALTIKETWEYIQWADEHKDEASVDKIGVYHPVIIARWLTTYSFPVTNGMVGIPVTNKEDNDDK